MKITILTPTNDPNQPHHTNLADLLKRGLARFKLSSEKRVSVECDGVEITLEETTSGIARDDNAVVIGISTASR